MLCGTMQNFTFGFTTIFMAALAIHLFVRLWLSLRQTSMVLRHRDAVPTEFADHISLSEHQKAADYTLAGATFGRITLVFNALLLLGWTLAGGLNQLDQFWLSFSLISLSPVQTGVAVLLSFMFLGSLLELPFSIYQTFVLENRFGFNRTTLATFIGDLAKEWLLLLVLGAPIIAVVLSLMNRSGDLWWLFVWIFWTGFSLLLMWAFPTFIAPLFNKFLPLEDTSLKARIENLLNRCGFKSKGIFVMDGSRRSGHGNAYFTGLGNNKRIVFFDTLIQSLTPDEIEAVLAHELGHFARKHVFKRMAGMMIGSLAALALLGWLMKQPSFYQDLGVTIPSSYMALALFLMISPLFSVFLQPVLSYFSRKQEFEADDFAKQNARASDLVHALVKLYKENASTLTPDPLYSAFHDSHPPAPIRIAHLQAQ